MTLIMHYIYVPDQSFLFAFPLHIKKYDSICCREKMYTSIIFARNFSYGRELFHSFYSV